MEIYDETRQAYLLQEGLATGSEFWLGLTDLNAEGIYIWDNSQLEVNFTAWSENEPSQGADEDCVAMTAANRRPQSVPTGALCRHQHRGL